jgi:hypothetical protein
MRQHQQPCWKSKHNSANDGVAWLAPLESLGYGTRLHVWRTDQEGWPLRGKPFDGLD